MVSEPKTAKSRRRLPLPVPVAALLKAQRVSQAEDRLRAANVWAETDYAFTTEHGQPLDPRNVVRAVTLAATRAGLSRVNVHSLRHSAATAMLEAGVHLKGVSDLLGHADIRITAETYGHLRDEVAKSAMAGLYHAFAV